MTKVTIDRALIEQALETLEIGDNFRPGLARVALRAALAEPAMEPACYQYQSRDGSWHPFLNEKHYVDTVADGSWPIRALYTSPPPPAEPVVEPVAALDAWYESLPGFKESVFYGLKQANESLAETVVEPVSDDLRDTVTRLMELAERYSTTTFNSALGWEDDDYEIARQALEAELVRLFTPLTDEQIKQTVGAGGEYWASSKIYIKAIFQAAEKAHGIEGES